MPRFSTHAVAVALCALGCSRSEPVTEISLADSGVTVTESTSTLVAGDWPRWRGPTGDGVVPDQSLPTTWSDSTNIRWRTDIPGRGHSSPIVVGDRVFLATANEGQQQQWVIAYDRDGGGEVWRTLVHEGGFPSSREVHNKATNANGTLACNGESLFTAFLNSQKITASALDLDGEILWQRELGDFDSKFGYAPSPVVYKSLVIFAADNQGGGYLAAVDTGSGEIAWRVTRGDASSYSSPTIAQVGGRDQLLISGGDAVSSYDPATGELNWQTAGIAEATCGTIVTSDDKIYASGGFPDRETVCLSADGERLWSNDTDVYEPSMVIANGSLIAVDDDGKAHAWDVVSGEKHWTKRLGGNVSASPIACNGLVFAPNLDGETFVFRADPEFELVSTNRLGSDCYASPAVAGGQIYLRIGIGDGPDRREQLVCIAADEG